jgi:protein gp37
VRISKERNSNNHFATAGRALETMAEKSTIEWTDTTWNPVTGCTKISIGCDNCYAARFSERFRGVPGHPFENGFDLTVRPERLTQPLDWKKPRMIFVNSMSDLCHKAVPKAHIARVFDTMESADWHIYQILTKRSSLLQKFINDRYKARPAPAHIWFGVSVEGSRATSRIAHLQSANAAVRFLSVEPLIGPVGRLNLTGIDWVIVGGESGPHARPMQTPWAIDVRNQCLRAKVAFFFKQWGGRSPKSGGRLLEGEEWNQFPAALLTSPRQHELLARA